MYYSTRMFDFYDFGYYFSSLSVLRPSQAGHESRRRRLSIQIRVSMSGVFNWSLPRSVGASRAARSIGEFTRTRPCFQAKAGTLAQGGLSH